MCSISDTASSINCSIRDRNIRKLIKPTIKNIKEATPTNSAGDKPLGADGIVAEKKRYAVQKNKIITNGKPDEKRISVPATDFAFVSMFSLPTINGTLRKLKPLGRNQIACVSMSQ